MAISDSQSASENFSSVVFSDGAGGLPKLKITSAHCEAEIYLQGAHVTHFQKRGEQPVLFLSQRSKFQAGIAIRGGIPVIFPWFGPREGQPAHGFARTQTWNVREIITQPDGSITVHLTLPEFPTTAPFPHSAVVDYLVTVGETLTAELRVTNLSGSQPFTYEDCLHTYFTIGDIPSVSISGLKGVEYLDKTAAFARKTEQSDQIKITSETDRVYTNTESTTEITDPKLCRRIRIEKSGSRSTVVWNPWIEKAAQMSDFGDDEYKTMLCVESGNVGDNKITLPAGQTASLKVVISTHAL